MKNLEIGLAGYYGFNALSDEFIRKAIQDAVEWCVFDVAVNWRILPLGTGDWDGLDMVILGGGSLFGATKGFMGNLRHYDYPFYILGTGVRGKLTEDWQVENTAYLFNRATDICVRGMGTMQEISRHGIDTSKVSCIGDSIFLIEPARGVHLLPNIDYGNNYVAVVYRPLYCDALMDKIVKFLEKGGETVKFVALSKEQLDVGAPLSLRDTYYALLDSQMVITNRLHPACLALINEIPAIPIEIEFGKVGEVCRLLEYPYWVRGGGMDEFEMWYRQLNELSLHDDMWMLRRRIRSIRVGLYDFVRRMLRNEI